MFKFKIKGGDLAVALWRDLTTVLNPTGWSFLCMLAHSLIPSKIFVSVHIPTLWFNPRMPCGSGETHDFPLEEDFRPSQDLKIREYRAMPLKRSLQNLPEHIKPFSNRRIWGRWRSMNIFKPYFQLYKRGINFRWVPAVPLFVILAIKRSNFSSLILCTGVHCPFV